MLMASLVQKGGTHDGPHLHGYGVPSGVALVLLGSLPAPWQVLQPFGLGWALAMRSYPAGLLSPNQVAAVSVAGGQAVRSQCGEDECLPVYFFRRCHQMCW